MHSTIDSTAHSRPLNSLEHKPICILCTTSMTNLPLDRDANPVPLRFEPQLDRMSHRENIILSAACISYRICFNKKKTINRDTLLYIPLPGPLRGPAGTLPMFWRCPPDIPYTTPYGPPTGSRDAAMSA